MSFHEIIEFFKDKQMFVFEKKVYNVENVKCVSGNLVLLTDKRTFNLLPSEIKPFIEQCNFDNLQLVESRQLPTHPQQPRNSNYLPVDVDGLLLPNSSMRAKDKLDALIDMFDDPKAITDDFMKKAAALCTITDKIVNVEKLQLDFVRLQKQ